MEKRNRIIKHNEKEIYYHDHRGLSGDELMENIKNGVTLLKDSNSHEILDLADFRDVFINEEILNFFKSDEQKKIQEKVKKTATLGVVGIKKIFFNLYNKISSKQAKAFTSEDEARKWLIQD